MLGSMFDILTSWGMEVLTAASSEIVLFVLAALSYVIWNPATPLLRFKKHSKGTGKMITACHASCKCEAASGLLVRPVVQDGSDCGEIAPLEKKHGLVHHLENLPVNLTADIFAYCELREVHACAGVTCSALHASVWQHPDFWRTLGGQLFVDSLGKEESKTSNCTLVRTFFRQWVFGIDGDWSLALEERASCEHPSDAVKEVLEFVKVLLPGDASLMDVSRLVGVAECAIQRMDVRDDSSYVVASDLVSCCRTRQEIFSNIELERLNTALASLEERVKRYLDAEGDVSNRWFFSEELQSCSMPLTQHGIDPSLLSQSFIALMESQAHHA